MPQRLTMAPWLLRAPSSLNALEHRGRAVRRLSRYSTRAQCLLPLRQYTLPKPRITNWRHHIARMARDERVHQC